jgi:RNA polymerase sigma factor (sigma-70 family)
MVADAIDDTTTDAALIVASWADAEVFASVYDRHATALYRYARRRLGEQAADDAVGDTMLAAFRVRRRYDPSRPDARPWLFGILTREISRRRRLERSRYRAVARLGPVDRADHGPAERVADQVAAEAVRVPLAHALASLAPRDRHVLLLVAWADLSYREVAVALEIPIGTVRSRLNRARRQVRAKIPDQDLSDENEAAR